MFQKNKFLERDQKMFKTLLEIFGKSSEISIHHVIGSSSKIQTHAGQKKLRNLIQKKLTVIPPIDTPHPSIISP